MLQKKILSLFNAQYGDWARPKDRPYADAMFAEATELFNYTGWEWWKNQEVTFDPAPVRMEVADILLSLIGECQLTWEVVPGDLYPSILEPTFEQEQILKVNHPIDVVKLKQYTKAFILDVLVYDLHMKDAVKHNQQIGLRNVVKRFWNLVTACGMTFDDVYLRYVGKIELNKLRRNNGQSNGVWKGIGPKIPGHYLQIWKWPERPEIDPKNPDGYQEFTMKKCEDNIFLDDHCSWRSADQPIEILQPAIGRILTHTYDKVLLQASYRNDVTGVG